MQIEKNFVDYMSDARALRTKYMRGLMIAWWAAMLGFVRSAGRALRRGHLESSGHRAH
jgi:hypothetical protein